VRGFDAKVDARHEGFIKLRGPKEVEVEHEARLDVRVYKDFARACQAQTLHLAAALLCSSLSRKNLSFLYFDG
jgi:hypothetical protein